MSREFVTASLILSFCHDLLFVQGSKRVALWTHFHGSGGTSVCKWAQRAAEDNRSGVKLQASQLKANCNSPLWNPIQTTKDQASFKSNLAARRKQQHANQRGHSCRSLSLFFIRGGSTWLATETSLEFTPPCSGVAFLAAVPTPFGRVASILKRAIGEGKEKPIDDAIDFFQNSRLGDSVLLHACAPPNCCPVFGAGQLDNYMTRFLLGEHMGRQLRWGEIAEQHFKRALAKLRKFDVVFPLERLSNALPAIQCVLGDDYNLGADSDRYNWLSRANVHQDLASSLQQKLSRLETLVNKQNIWDLKLYNASVNLWNNHQCKVTADVAKGNVPTLLLYIVVGVHACLSVVQGALS